MLRGHVSLIASNSATLTVLCFPFHNFSDSTKNILLEKRSSNNSLTQPSLTLTMVCLLRNSLRVKSSLLKTVLKTPLKMPEEIYPEAVI